MFNGQVAATNRSRADVDDFDVDNGDLGLGSGLKPGGFCAPHSLPLYHLPPTRSDVCSNENTSQTSPTDLEEKTKRGKLTRLFSRSNSKSSRKSSESHDTLEGEVYNREEAFPSYADVTYGTSIRQQKLLFEQDLGHIRLKKSPSDISDLDISAGSERSQISPLKSHEIERKLQQANEEVEELHLELENCQRRLDAKYQAIEILKQQAEEAHEKTEEQDRRTSDYNQRLQKEINHLNFVLDCHQSSALDSQRTWASRFDRVCQENSGLMMSLRARSEELRKLTARNMALLREREELLALLDVQERLQYEKSRTSISEDDHYNHFTSAELAVLGACTCRGRKPEPCGCAVAAANMRKEIVKLREEMDMYEQRTEEAYTTVEAYRIAFEEQIARNKDIGLKLAEISTASPSPTKGSKTKNVLKWIIRTINDGDQLDFKSRPCEDNNKLTPTETGSRLPDLDLSHLTDRELLIMLLDMVNEKSELRAHQKVAAKILARKTQELESKLEVANGDVPCK